MRHIKSISIVLGIAALAAGAYIVKEGDTLWDISDEYLNDPFAWPDLWEKNRHIKDPHWIYPGDSLYLGETDSSTAPATAKSGPCAKAEPDSTLPSGVSAPSGCTGEDESALFEQMLGNLSKDSGHKKKAPAKAASYYYLQHPEPKIFNGYYQALSPVILSPDSLKADKSWFSIRSGENRKPLVHIPETELVVGIGKNTDEKATVGAIVEIWDARRANLPETQTRSAEKAAILHFTGIAKITDVGDTLSRAILLQSMREIKIEFAKARLQKPSEPINVQSYSPVKSAEMGKMAHVRYSLGKNLVIGLYDYVMIDQGADGNYALGDGVAIWEKDSSDAQIPPRLLARGVVTSQNEDHSIVLLRETYYNDRHIEVGNLVSVTHKANRVQ